MGFLESQNSVCCRIGSDGYRSSTLGSEEGLEQVHFPVRDYLRETPSDEPDRYGTFARRCNCKQITRMPPILVCTQCGNYYLGSNFTVTQMRKYYKSANVLRCAGCEE